MQSSTKKKVTSMNTTNPGTRHEHVQPSDSAVLGKPRSLATASLIGGMAAFILAASPLHAGELPAMAAESIHIGDFSGVFYYTHENDGYRVVATLAEGEAGVPVRFSATLAEGQSATISVPGKLGAPGQDLEISRSGEKLTFTEVGAISDERVEPITE
jgi:hypothetical protein